jgi:hypothetical protein
MSINQKLLARLMDCQEDAHGYRDDRDCPEEYAKYQTNADILREAEYTLGTYFEDGNMNCDLKEENYSLWRNQVARIKRLIEATKKEIEKEKV